MIHQRGFILDDDRGLYCAANILCRVRMILLLIRNQAFLRTYKVLYSLAKVY